MNSTFLLILSAALKGTTPKLPPLSTEEQKELIKLAEIHRVLPLVYDCMHTCGISLPQNSPVQKHIRLLVSQQALRTLAFSQIYSTLTRLGVTPVVVKGIVCRSLYPKPDLRTSSDEDLLISPKDYPLCRKLLEEMSFRCADGKEPAHYQHSFVNGEGVHLELHTSLFDSQNPFFDNWNKVFEDLQNKTVTLNAEGTDFVALQPTEHLIYLILHALKHFIHSGVGIRQVCDIVMFANHYTNHINWLYFTETLQKLSALKFAMGIFSIGKNHLNLSQETEKQLLQFAAFPKSDESLLDDILQSGVFGSATLSRKHSGSITFAGAQSKKQNIFRQILPPAKSLGPKYTYAKKTPILLPVAWAHRLLCYRKELKSTEHNSPMEAVQTGKARLRLLKEYGLAKTN